MKTVVRLALVSLGVVLILGWMLATPILKINHLNGVVADGSAPAPPPPFSTTGNILLADGSAPAPPPPFSPTGNILLADGSAPAPPPPFSV